MKYIATLLAGAALGVSVAGTALAQAGTCTWPMHAMVEATTQRDYPTTVLLVFEKPEAADDLIRIREITMVGLAKFAREFPSIVQSSSEWRQLQSRLSCNNRAGDFAYGLSVVDGRLHASFSANLEKYWCASSMVPCPVIPADPLRMCRKDANGKLWGARVSSTSRIEMQQDGSAAFKAVVIDTSTSSSTSGEQDFIRDLLGASFMGPIGVDAIRKLESSALDAIKSSMRDGFNNQSFTLADGAALPEFPNYRPKVMALAFVDMPTNGINARIERVVPQYRESTGCALALQLRAIHVSVGTGPRRGR